MGGKAKSDEIVILIMGATGAGKSSFINALVGRDVVHVGHSLRSDTSEIQSVPFELDKSARRQGYYTYLEDYHLFIVDTPGFDDTIQDDAIILQRIAQWLKSSYDKRALLGGVIYLQDISLNRFNAAARQNLNIFKSMCGDKLLNKVILATTMWKRVDRKTGAGHEQELVECHWKELVSGGSMLHQYSDSHDSAWEIINALLEPLNQRLRIGSKEEYLSIQIEMGRNRKRFSRTAAAKLLKNIKKRFWT